MEEKKPVLLRTEAREHVIESDISVAYLPYPADLIGLVVPGKSMYWSAKDTEKIIDNLKKALEERAKAKYEEITE